MEQAVHSTSQQSEILSQCLQAIEHKQSTIEECGKRYPEFTELGELLDITSTIRETPRPVMSAAAKAALMQQALLKFQTQIIQPRPSQPRLSWRWVSRPAFAFSIILVFILGSSVGLVKAASNTVPGDSLYFIKRLDEQAQITFTSSDALPAVLFHIAQTRLHEIDILQSRSQILSPNVVIDTFQSVASALKVQPDPLIRKQLLQQATSVFDQAQASGKVNVDLVTTDLALLANISPTHPATISPTFITNTPTSTSTVTASPTLTPTPTDTTTPELTLTSTSTDVEPTDTDIPEPTLTPSFTATDRPQPTDTETPVETFGPSPTNSGNATPHPKPTHKPTHTSPTNPGNSGGNGNGGNGNGGTGKGKGKP